MISRTSSLISMRILCVLNLVFNLNLCLLNLNHNVCSILCSQLPKEVQSKAKSSLADGIVTDGSAREFMVKLKSWIVHRGIPLDVGFKNLEPYGEVKPDKVMSCTNPNRPEGRASVEQESSTSNCLVVDLLLPCHQRKTAWHMWPTRATRNSNYRSIRKVPASKGNATNVGEMTW